MQNEKIGQRWCDNNIVQHSEQMYFNGNTVCVCVCLGRRICAGIVDIRINTRNLLSSTSILNLKLRLGGFNATWKMNSDNILLR